MSDESHGERNDEGEVDSVAVVCFERNEAVGRRVVEHLTAEYPEVKFVGYEAGAFEDAFSRFDAIVGVMAVGIVVRKTAPLLESKWTDPAVVAVDESLNWAIPLLGGHHGANSLARNLSTIGAVPTVTTGTEVAGAQSVERRAAALDATIETPDSTVATNLAVLDEELGPVARLDGPKAVLVSEEVTVLKRTQPDGIVLGTGCVSGVDPEQCLRAWNRAVETVDRSFEDVEFVATGRLKADEEGLFDAAQARDLGVVLFERDTLERFEGPSTSKAPDLVDWPGIAESSAVAGGRRHELVMEKRTYDGSVTVAVGR